MRPYVPDRMGEDDLPCVVVPEPLYFSYSKGPSRLRRLGREYPLLCDPIAPLEPEDLAEDVDISDIALSASGMMPSLPNLRTWRSKTWNARSPEGKILRALAPVRRLVGVLLGDLRRPGTGPLRGRRVCEIVSLVSDAGADREHVERRLLDEIKRRRAQLEWDVLRFAVPEDDADTLRFLWSERFERLREKDGYVQMVYDRPLPVSREEVA